MPTPPDATDIKYPAAIDDDTSLFGDPANMIEFTLNGGIDSSVVSFVVNDPSNYIGTAMDEPGFLRFTTGEIVYFEAMDAGSDTFSTVTRGVGGSSAAAHLDGEILRLIPVAEFNVQYKAAILAIQNELGINPAGSLATLVARLAISLNDDGTLKGKGITDGDLLTADGTPNSGEWARYTAAGIEGLTQAEFITAMTEVLTDLVGAMVTGGVETRISVTYDDANNRFDFVVAVPDIILDTTPVLGGDLDAADKDITNIKQVDFQDTHANGDSGATPTIDWNEGNRQSIRATAAEVDLSYTDPPGPCHLTLYVLGDGTARLIDADHDTDAEWLENGEPSAWGATDGEVAGVLHYDFDPSLTPKYVCAGIARI